MKDAKKHDVSRSGRNFPTYHTLNSKLKEIRESPSVLLNNISIIVLGILFARCHILFGARPLAIALLSLLPSGVFPALIGSVIGALSLGATGTPYAIIYTLTVAIRIIISGSSDRDGRAFGESLLLRICESTIFGFILGIYQLLLSGFGAESLLFALVSTLTPPIICFALSGIFDAGISFSSFFTGGEDLFSLADKSDRERYAVIFFYFSASLLSLLIAMSLVELDIFGFSFAYVYVCAITLFVSHRYGAVRGAAAGFVSALPLSATHAVSFGLAGAASGILFSLNGLWGVGAGALLLTVWSAYAKGAMGILEVLPEYAIASAIMLPFVNKSLPKPIKTEEKPPSNNAGEMVFAMTLAYRSRPAVTLDTLEDALVGISTAARGFEVGSTVREDEYRDMIISDARGFYGEEYKAARELCIEKSTIIAARLKAGQDFTAAMLGIGDDPHTKELCESITKHAVAMEEERYRQSLTAGKYEDYRLISKLISEARADSERERAADSELCERLNLLFRECGFSDGIIKLFGERQRHLIAAGEDPDGNLITSPQLHSELQRLLEVRLGEPEYFRRGTTVLMQVSAVRRLSAAGAIATIQGSSGEVSGDVSCHFSSDDDFYYALLSDGMGSGELARETATFVTKFLSYALRAGGYRDTVLHLLNNIIRRRGEECSATVDLFSLDLIRGDATFIKSGAAPSYVKRDSSIFRIRSETAPIGLMSDIDAERVRVEVRPGDYVIILSDGVSSTPEDAPWLPELLTEPPKRSPKEYAEYLLSEAVKRSKSGDDMTVLVTKIESVDN